MNKKRLLITSAVLSILALGVNALLLQGSDIESQNLGLGQVEKEEGEGSSSSSSSSSSSKASSSSEVPRDAKAAKEAAENYLSYAPFSKEGLYDQLIVEQFPQASARDAVNKIEADWKEQALKKAKEYMEFSSPSDEELRKRLTKDKFTKEEIDSALDKLKKK